MEKTNKLKYWWNYFSSYEKWWFFIFTIATIVVSILIPEETTNGISGTFLTFLYLFNVILGILCELLTAKQSKWSLFIYIFVEIIEIAKFILLSALFSSMIISLFFWLPMHIITFINWHKHEDKMNKEVTVVRSLKPLHATLMFIGVAIWTLALGYVFAAFGPDSELYSSEASKVAVCYLDACYSALCIANGVLLYFRFKENWIVWLVASALSIVTMAITGLWVFIVLQLGYITNTIYGYLCWTKYIKNNKQTENNENTTENENYNVITTKNEIENENKTTTENQKDSNITNANENQEIKIQN